MNGLLVIQTIPIYTKQNPHPIKKRADCGLEQHYKNGLRAAMRKELLKATDVNAVIEKYRKKVSQL